MSAGLRIGKHAASRGRQFIVSMGAMFGSFLQTFTVLQQILLINKVAVAYPKKIEVVVNLTTTKIGHENMSKTTNLTSYIKLTTK